MMLGSQTPQTFKSAAFDSKRIGESPSPLEVACNLCGGFDRVVVFRAGEAQISQIVRCSSCGLMFASPRTKAPDVIEFREYEPDLKWVEMNVSRRLKEELQVRDYRDTRSYLGRSFPGRGLLVEIGSGLGYLLRAFQEDGWSVHGFEPWAAAALYAKRISGVETEAKTLEEAGLPAKSIDVAVMLHVIEHLPDPSATLKEIFRVLRPGGTLVLETPRYDSFMFWLLGRRERSVSCSGHIYFFTNRTLAKLIEQAGFRIERSMAVGRSLTLDRLLWNLAIMSKSSKIQTNTETVSAKLRLNRIRFRLNLRDMVRVYCRKSAESIRAPLPG